MQIIDQKDGGPGSQHLIFWTSLINVRELGSIMPSKVNERGRDNGSDVTITPSQNENATSESLYSPLCPLCKLGFSWPSSVICQRMRRITPVFGSTSGNSAQESRKPEEVRENRKVKRTQTGTFHMIGSEPGTLYCDKQQSIKAEWSWRLFCRIFAPVGASVWISGQRRQFLCCIKIANGTKLSQEKRKRWLSNICEEPVWVCETFCLGYNHVIRSNIWKHRRCYSSLITICECFV